MRKTIEIKVEMDGSFKIEASGYPDSTCLDALKELEAIFGKASKIEMKQEARKHHVKQTTKA
jgi:hypothetical protein